MAADDVREWEIAVMRDGKVLDDGAAESVYEGTYAGARERAEDIIGVLGEYGGNLEARIRPSGVLFESVPAKWRIDEERGELFRLVPSTDPLPHVAVRAMEGGGVHVVCERGLNVSKPALAVIHAVVLRHLNRQASLEAVVGVRHEVERELALLAARRDIMATPVYETLGRTWS